MKIDGMIPIQIKTYHFPKYYYKLKLKHYQLQRVSCFLAILTFVLLCTYTLNVTQSFDLISSVYFGLTNGILSTYIILIFRAMLKLERTIIFQKRIISEV